MQNTNQIPSVTITFDQNYDDYAGAFIVTSGDQSEESMTIDDAFVIAKTFLLSQIN